jgi:hypothetical protein
MAEATGTERRAALAAAAIAAVTLAGCGTAGTGDADPPPASPTALRQYLARVEPIRRGVNRLLDRADPVLAGYRRHRVGPRRAQRRIGRLEARFAGFEERIAAVRPVPPALAAAQRAYAHAYVLEDAYLRALAAAIPGRRFAALPDTEEAQRAAIVAWRERLRSLAARLGLALPADVDIAGTGEIVPSPLEGEEPRSRWAAKDSNLQP